MFITNTYDSRKILLRYYLEKNLPHFLYPYFNNLFFEKIVNHELFLCFREEFRHYNIEMHLNYSNPTTFTDKINLLKLSEVTELKTKLTDKITAKEYVKTKIPELHQAKIFQTAKSFDELDFTECPSSFIIKTNHACKTGILIYDKNNITKQDYENYRKYYKKTLNINYAFWGTFELQYRDIIPKVFIEENLFAKSLTTKIKEYEVWCINGSPVFIHYSCSENNKDFINITFLNDKFEPNKFAVNMPVVEKFDVSTQNMDKIIKYSKILSSDFKFCRCDFFEVDNELFFGEVTFTPHSCNIRFFPEEYDLILGEMLNI